MFCWWRSIISFLFKVSFVVSISICAESFFISGFCFFSSVMLGCFVFKWLLSAVSVEVGVVVVWAFLVFVLYLLSLFGRDSLAVSVCSSDGCMGCVVVGFVLWGVYVLWFVIVFALCVGCLRFFVYVLVWCVGVCGVVWMWDFRRDTVLPVFGPEVRRMWTIFRASPTTMP